MGKKLVVNQGDRYGKLTILMESEPQNSQRYFVCKCNCGKTKIISLSKLRSGNTKSCGCFQSEMRGKGTIIHGCSKTRLYRIWIGMKDRCENPKCIVYQYYGKRGITFCKEWVEFVPFQQWALGNGYNDHLTLERNDVNGNYEPSNCIWIPFSKQALNTRKSLRLEFNGQTKALKEWADQIGISYLILYKRLMRGWSVEKTLSTPTQIQTQFSRRPS